MSTRPGTDTGAAAPLQRNVDGRRLGAAALERDGVRAAPAFPRTREHPDRLAIGGISDLENANRRPDSES